MSPNHQGKKKKAIGKKSSLKFSVDQAKESKCFKHCHSEMQSRVKFYENLYSHELLTYYVLCGRVFMGR